MECLRRQGGQELREQVESASANTEVWERLNAWRRVKMSVRSQLGNPYGDDVESASQAAPVGLLNS